MTTPFDTDMAGLVTELMVTFGVTATLQTRVPGVVSYAGGSQAPSTNTDTTVKSTPPLSMVSARTQASEGGRVIGLTGGDVLPTDLYVIIDAVDTAGAATPTPTAKQDRLTVAGVTYAIWKVGTLYTGDVIAAYELALRKS